MKNSFSKAFLILLACLLINVPLQAIEWEEMTDEQKENTLEMHRACLAGDIPKVIVFLNEENFDTTSHGIKIPKEGGTYRLSDDLSGMTTYLDDFPDRSGTSSGTALHYLFLALERMWFKPTKNSAEKMNKISQFIIELIEKGANPTKLLIVNHKGVKEEGSFLQFNCGMIIMATVKDSFGFKKKLTLNFINLLLPLINSGISVKDIHRNTLGLAKDGTSVISELASLIHRVLGKSFPSPLLLLFLSLDESCCDVFDSWEGLNPIFANKIRDAKNAIRETLFHKRSVAAWLASQTYMPRKIAQTIASFF